VPKLRKQTFETAIIERYKRRETSVEEAMIETYLASDPVRRAESAAEVYPEPARQRCTVHFISTYLVQCPARKCAKSLVYSR